MSVSSGQAVTAEFRTRRFDTGDLADADSPPSGTLYVNGTADAASVTVTHHSTGRYKAAVTLPPLSAGVTVQIEIAATVNGVADASIVWSDTIDPAPEDAGPAADPADVDDAIAASALGPREVQTDAGRVQQHPIPDLIAADKYLASKAAGGDPKKSLRFSQMVRRDPR